MSNYNYFLTCENNDGSAVTFRVNHSGCTEFDLKRVKGIFEELDEAEAKFRKHVGMPEQESQVRSIKVTRVRRKEGA